MIEHIQNFINRFVTQDRVYWFSFVFLCVLVLFLLYLFLALSIYVSLLRSIISHNKAHGWGISLKYGWHGVETTAVPPNLPPKENSCMVCNRRRLSSKKRVTLWKALGNRTKSSIPKFQS